MKKAKILTLIGIGLILIAAGILMLSAETVKGTNGDIAQWSESWRVTSYRNITIDGHTFSVGPAEWTITGQGRDENDTIVDSYTIVYQATQNSQWNNSCINISCNYSFGNFVSDSLAIVNPQGVLTWYGGPTGLYGFITVGAGFGAGVLTSSQLGSIGYSYPKEWKIGGCVGAGCTVDFF